MANKCYQLTREDGEELGVFDRRDEAQRVAEYDARSRGYDLRWTSVLGGAHGKPTTSGRDVFKYEIKDVECP
jgi:hypothetical protein